MMSDLKTIHPKIASFMEMEGSQTNSKMYASANIGNYINLPALLNQLLATVASVAKASTRSDENLIFFFFWLRELLNQIRRMNIFLSLGECNTREV